MNLIVSINPSFINQDGCDYSIHFYFELMEIAVTILANWQPGLRMMVVKPIAITKMIANYAQSIVHH